MCRYKIRTKKDFSLLGPDQIGHFAQSRGGPRPFTMCLSKWVHLPSSLRLSFDQMNQQKDQPIKILSFSVVFLLDSWGGVIWECSLPGKWPSTIQMVASWME